MEIYSIRHRGLKRFYERGEARGLPQDRIEKLRRILTAINEADALAELEAMPGGRLHVLRGDRLGTLSISLSGNWRVTFRVVDDAIHDLDLEDYH